MNSAVSPTPENATDPDLFVSDAAKLFLQRARGVKPSLEFGDADREPLLDILRFTGGMPLALELLATWVRVLPLAGIAAELGHNPDLFRAAPADMPERHRNLYTVFEHSFDRLDDAEKKNPRGALGL